LTIGVITVIVLLVISLFVVGVRGRKKKAQANSGQQQNVRPGYPVTPPALGPLNNSMTAFGAPPPPRPQPTPGQPGAMPPMQRQPGPVQPPPGQPFPGRPVQGPPFTGGFPQGPGPQNSAPAQETLRAWPCGHMNRLNARFCSVCGELASEPPTIRRQVEQ
jgi:hypothetical protein